MLKGLTSTFKNGCNNVEVMYREYLVLGNQTIPIKAELSDDSYENGNFIGTFIFKTIKFETDAQYDFKNKEFEYYKEVNGESVKIGTFITTEVEINDTTEIVKVVGMDYGLKTQVEYTSTLNYASGNVTLLDVWNECCTLSGLESGIDYFPNGDFIVDNDQFTGTGATIRDVFKGIAMSSGTFVKVMNDDKIYLVFNEYTSDLENATINGSGSVNDGYAIDNLQIEGKVEQEGTPTPDNPEEIKTVSGIGNLFDKNKSISSTTRASISIEDGVIKVTQTETGGSGFVIVPISNSDDLLGKTVTLSAILENSASKNTGVGIYSIKSDGTSKTFYAPLLTSTGSVQVTLPDSYSVDSVGFALIFYSVRGSSGAVGDYTIYSNVQLEEGTIPHQYVPYGHWLPVKVSNKNLFDNDNANILNAYLNNSTNKIVSNNSTRAIYISCQPNTTYTVSKMLSSRFIVAYTTDIPANNVAIRGAIEKPSSTSITITTDSNANYLAVYFYHSSYDTSITVNDILNTMQIEEGTTATDYIEHQEQTTLIDLNKYDENNNIVGNYEICTTLTAPSDNLDVLTIKDGRAVLTKRMGKYVVNEDTLFGSATQQVGLFWIYKAFTFVSYRGISNFFVNNPDTRITANVPAFQYLNDGEFAFRWSTTPSNRDRVYFKYLDLGSDTNAFKNWAIENKLTLYYRQNVETIILRGTYDINLYEGVNHISIEDELEPTMVMSYYKDNLDIIEDYVELEDKRDTHPWTCLRLGMSQVEGENVDYIDEDLVAKYGENWLILNDNPFAYTQQKRQQLITNIFNRIKEFGYSAFVSKTSFKPYLTAGDIVKFRNREGNLVKTILLRYNHNVEEITLESPSETSATVNYVYPLTDIDLYKRTEIQVDKANNQIRSNVENIGLLQISTSSNADNINSLTSLVNGQGEQIDALGTRITQNVSEITASVSAIQEEISEGVGLVKTTSVTIDDSGLNVSTDTSKIKTTMTNDTFKITDSGNTELAKFGYDESQGISVAEMDNLTVKNYFIAGVHRVETIEIDGEKRTGWFYMED